ncbi:hypothetical protein N7G274_002571 [Stereocaulon virgatum]|uniref:Uncharacterized protein n=1 Tax=Stereocaulon virgatum TaxID=373712 RepID=A0ABR4AIW3_9LECA
MAEAVTPPDLICSTPSPVARSPISSPLPLSAPSFISIHSIPQRVLDDLDISKSRNIALERNDMMESFRGLNIDPASFLSHEERGILTDAIKWRIQRLNFRDPVWVELMSEIHEALWDPSTQSLNDGVEVLHGGLFGLRSLFRKIMDCCKPSKHLLRTHVGSKEIPSMLWGMLTYIDNMQTRLNSELCAAQLALYLIHLLLLRTYAATEKRCRNTEDSEIDLLNLYLAVKSIIALLTTKNIKILLERECKNAHCGFCSPAPPSPGSGRSQISFVSDSVVDWKELVRGRSPHDSTQGNAEAWIDRLETLE